MTLCLLKDTWASAWEPAPPGTVFAVSPARVSPQVQVFTNQACLLHTALESVVEGSRGGVLPLKHMFIAVLFHILCSCWLLMAMVQKT